MRSSFKPFTDWCLALLFVTSCVHPVFADKPASAIYPTSIDAVIPHWTRSYALYHQPHMIWLAEDEAIGANLPELNQVLTEARKQHRRPELVVYGIPDRDMGQSSAGGFKNWGDYQADNVLSARQLKQFVQDTHIQPRIILEPDALGHAIQYRRDRQDDPVSMALYQKRTQTLRWLIQLYQDAGCLVYLDAAHSGWFDYNDNDIQAMATALQDSGVTMANGLVSNVSNRQPLEPKPYSLQQFETHYLKRLLSKLNAPKLDIIVDTSRNGGPTRPRQVFLAQNGMMIDNETQSGRLIGHWEPISTPENPTDALLTPFFGKPMRASILLEKDKFKRQNQFLLTPPWLDPIGDVQLGPSPQDLSVQSQKTTGVNRFRYIKPPDDCDGSLNCPSRVSFYSYSQSKHDLALKTQEKQTTSIKSLQIQWPTP